MKEYNHISVLQREAIDALSPQADKVYVDCTLGLGGHTECLLERTQGRAKVIAIDRDEEAIAIAQRRLYQYQESISYYHLCFAQLPIALEEEGIEKIDGLILDAGVSSLQLDASYRGFSFRADAPLDMRMDRTTGMTASHFLATATLEQLVTVLQRFGEEPLAKKIARAIIQHRKTRPIITTLQLAHIVEQCYPTHWKRTARMHPATRTFQALRIHINNELDELQNLIDTAIPYLNTGASIAIISFHSLEDRVVKHTFKRYTIQCICPPHYMRCECNHTPIVEIVTKKPLLPSEEELVHNPRARSAKLRVARKL